jgi:DNA-binding transcriptional ArsR family regulator
VTVDKDGGGTVAAGLLSLLGGVDQLVLDPDVVAMRGAEHLLEPLVGDLPVRAAVEVLNRDPHDSSMLSCFPDMYSAIEAPEHRAAAARFFRVLGDPTRLHILELLEERDRTVGELVSATGQPQPRVSTHLACLRHCGFVSAERRGKEMVYRLALEGLDRLVAGAGTTLEPVAERLATCTRIGPDWV